METLKENKKLSKKIAKTLKLNSIKRKILLILPSLNDYMPFVKILNKVDLSDYNVILKPHPVVKNKTLKYFKEKFFS